MEARGQLGLIGSLISLVVAGVLFTVGFSTPAWATFHNWRARPALPTQQEVISFHVDTTSGLWQTCLHDGACKSTVTDQFYAQEAPGWYRVVQVVESSTLVMFTLSGLLLIILIMGGRDAADTDAISASRSTLVKVYLALLVIAFVMGLVGVITYGVRAFRKDEHAHARVTVGVWPDEGATVTRQASRLGYSFILTTFGLLCLGPAFVSALIDLYRSWE